jgi:hypothetical protein
MPSADFLGYSEHIFSFEYMVMFSRLGDQVLRFTQSVTLPTSSNEVMQVNYLNQKKSVAGKHSPQHKYTLSVKSVVSPNTAAELWKWYRRVYPSQGVVGHPKDYKDNGILAIVDGRYGVVSTWTLSGVWPSSIEMGEGAEGNNEIIQVKLTLEVDDIDGPN